LKSLPQYAPPGKLDKPVSEIAPKRSYFQMSSTARSAQPAEKAETVAVREHLTPSAGFRATPAHRLSGLTLGELMNLNTGTDFRGNVFNTQVIPAPGTLGLLMLGGVVAGRRRRRTA